MRILSMVVIGLTLAATVASAEPLRLADMDLDRVTADVRNISIIARVVQGADYDSVGTADNIIRTFSDINGEAGFLEAPSTTNPGADDVDLAAPVSNVRSTAAPIGAVRVSNDDAGNAIGGSDTLVLRGGDLSGAGVVVFNGGAIAGNDRSATATRTVSRQIVARTSSTDNGAVVQTTGSFGKAASLFAGSGNAGLATSRLDTGIASGFSTSAFSGGSITSLLNGSFN